MHNPIARSQIFETTCRTHQSKYIAVCPTDSHTACSSDFDVAKIWVRSPQILFIFIEHKILYGIKVSHEHLTSILISKSTMCRQWRCKNSSRVPLDGLTIVSWQVLYVLGMPLRNTYSRGTWNCWVPFFQALPQSAPQLLHRLQVPLQLLLWWQLLELCIGARHWFPCIHLIFPRDLKFTLFRCTPAITIGVFVRCWRSSLMKKFVVEVPSMYCIVAYSWCCHIAGPPSESL